MMDGLDDIFLQSWKGGLYTFSQNVMRSFSYVMALNGSIKTDFLHRPFTNNHYCIIILLQLQNTSNYKVFINGTAVC